jgi:hypothetical protein
MVGPIALLLIAGCGDTGATGGKDAAGDAVGGNGGGDAGGHGGGGDGGHGNGGAGGAGSCQSIVPLSSFVDCPADRQAAQESIAAVCGPDGSPPVAYAYDCGSHYQWRRDAVYMLTCEYDADGHLLSAYQCGDLPQDPCNCRFSAAPADAGDGDAGMTGACVLRPSPCDAADGGAADGNHT